MITTVHAVCDVRIHAKEAQTLADAGYNVTLIAPHSRSETIQGIAVVPLPSSRSRLERIGTLGWKAFRLAWREKADAYHFHDPELLPWGWLLQTISRKPAIYDVHEYYRESILTKEWLPLCGRRLLGWMVAQGESFFAKRLAGVVTVNDELQRRFSLHNGKCIAVYNYPQAGLVAMQPACYKGRVPYSVIYLGGASQVRGYHSMIRAMEFVREREPQAKCIIVGAIDRAGMSESLVRSEDRLLRNGGLVHIGVVPYGEVLQYLRTACIAWLPWLRTPNNEKGMPTKLFEYMAAGLPVVASSMGYIAEIIDEAGCGVLVSPGDAEAHSEAILALLQDRTRAESLGAAGQAAMMSRFRWEPQGEKLLAFYEEILSETT